MIIGNKTFDTKHHGYIMGILNVTPDSFSDGGKYDHLDAALKHADEMVRDGAAIIDVGGESTRPGYTLISDEEEIARVTPVIEALKKEFDVPVSLDTYKSGVANLKFTVCLGDDKNSLGEIQGKCKVPYSFRVEGISDTKSDDIYSVSHVLRKKTGEKKYHILTYGDRNALKDLNKDIQEKIALDE